MKTLGEYGCSLPPGHAGPHNMEHPAVKGKRRRGRG